MKYGHAYSFGCTVEMAFNGSWFNCASYFNGAVCAIGAHGVLMLDTVRMRGIFSSVPFLNCIFLLGW